jgi:uncharacterized membrane protein
VTVVDVPRGDRSVAPDTVLLPARVEQTPTAALVIVVVVGVVFRLLWSARNGASFDESFTAMIGRHSWSGIFDALRSTDSHPPLDYLLRAPLARAGASDLVMRCPSLLFSVGALLLFAWWMRTRGVAGVVAVGLMAVSPFQIMYGGEARMYALLELLGVAAAILAERWLRDPQRWQPPAAGALVLVAVFDHVSGFLLAAGLLAVAGWRTGAVARRWRLGIGCALGVWAVVWGSSFLAQARVTHASWIERTSVQSIGDAVTEPLTNQHGVALLIVAAVVCGVVVVMRADRVLGRVVLCCGVVPLMLAALVGVFIPFFITRTVTVAAWVPCLAIGALVDRIGRRSRPVGVAAAVLTAVLVLPATFTFLDRHWEYDASIDHVLTVARSGDAVATVPDWYGPIVDWRIGVRAYGGVRPVELAGLRSAHAIRLGDGGPSGRVWVMSFAGDHRTYPALAHCAQDWTDGVIVVSCVKTPEVRSAVDD